MKQALRSLVRNLGYDIVRYPANARQEELPKDVNTEEREIFNRVKPFTMTNVERVVSLIRATRHISENGITGDVVECGVWQGGSMMAVALTLLSLADTARTLYLFDTFEGMSAPTLEDRDAEGNLASHRLKVEPKSSGVWAVAELESVRRNLHSTGYPQEKICFVKGKVEDTIPRSAPRSVSLLRLDTDWYESTKHELKHLYPRLSQNGVLIIDDYGEWKGARKATEEFFSSLESTPFLHRIDYTGRLIVKP